MSLDLCLTRLLGGHGALSLVLRDSVHDFDVAGPFYREFGVEEELQEELRLDGLAVHFIAIRLQLVHLRLLHYAFTGGWVDALR